MKCFIIYNNYMNAMLKVVITKMIIKIAAVTIYLMSFCHLPHSTYSGSTSGAVQGHTELKTVTWRRPQSLGNGADSKQMKSILQ